MTYTTMKRELVAHTSYMDMLRARDAHRLSDAEIEKMCESAHCDECDHFEPCTCEKEGICGVTTGYLTYYDRDMHVVKIPQRPRDWHEADDPACSYFEPSWTTLKEWGER